MELQNSKYNSLINDVGKLLAESKQQLSSHINTVLVTTYWKIGKYIVDLIFATRYPLRYSKQLDVMIDVGVSPRGSLALTQCAQVHAWMKGNQEVSVQDVQSVIHDVFRHRIIKSEHTRFSGIENDEIIDIIVKTVSLPESSK